MTQTQLFVSTDINEIPTSLTSQPNPVPAEPDREAVLILVIGSQKGIDKIVSALYASLCSSSRMVADFTCPDYRQAHAEFDSLCFFRLNWAKMLFYIRRSVLQN